MAFEPWQGKPADVRHWEWAVNPADRSVLIPEEDAYTIRQILEDKALTPIFHNAKFDVLGLERAVKCNPYNILKRCRDTAIESHILNSGESHALKDLALKYADIGLDDVNFLQKVVNKARDEARSINAKMVKLGMKAPFLIGGPDVFNFSKDAPDGGWWIVDTWLPKALFKWKNFVRVNNPRLAKQLLGASWNTVTEMTKKEAKASEEYCDTDSIRTLVLDEIFMSELEKNPKLINIHDNLQTPMLEVLYRMEQFGVPVDMEAINERSQHFSQKAEHHFAVAIELSGYPDLNPVSSQQLKGLLYRDWQIPVKKWTKPNKDKPDSVPGPSTDIDAICNIYLDYKDVPTQEAWRITEFCRNLVIAKKCNTCEGYLAAYRRSALPYKMGANSQEWWRLNPSFNNTGTKTVRLSGSNPNPQNISKGKMAFDVLEDILEGEDMSLRGVFGPMPGREWFTADFKQIQLAIFAYKTGHVEMIRAIESGKSLHDFMGRKIFKIAPDAELPDDKKTIAKNVNFGYIFGAGAAKIEATAKMPGLMDILAEMFPVVTEFIKETSKTVRKTGVVYAGDYPLQVDQKKPYMGVNYIVQGMEGVIVKTAMIMCHDYLMKYTGGQGQICLTVHDELVFDFPVGMGEEHVWNLRNIMSYAASLYGMKIGSDFKYTVTNWADTQKVEFDVAA